MEGGGSQISIDVKVKKNVILTVFYQIKMAPACRVSLSQPETSLCVCSLRCLYEWQIPARCRCVSDGLFPTSVTRCWCFLCAGQRFGGSPHRPGRRYLRTRVVASQRGFFRNGEPGQVSGRVRMRKARVDQILGRPQTTRSCLCSNCVASFLFNRRHRLGCRWLVGNLGNGTWRS